MADLSRNGLIRPHILAVYREALILSTRILYIHTCNCVVQLLLIFYLFTSTAFCDESVAKTQEEVDTG